MTTQVRRVGMSHVVLAMARREAQAALNGLGLYIAVSLSVAAAAWLLLLDVRALAVAGVLVRSDPFGAPLDAALLVLALFFAISAAAQTARDRESGTLEVLFYAPVDELTYILGKTFGLVAAYALMLPLVAFCFFLMSMATGFVLPMSFVLGLLFSVVPAAMVVSLGILLAIGTNRVRSAVLILGAVAFVFLGGAAAYSLVLMIPIENPSSPIIALRDSLAAVNGTLRWISPFAYLSRIVAEGVAIGAWVTVAQALAASLAGTALMIVIAATWLRRRSLGRASE
jgi:ABC-type transport system involved in multi-copper enzyme maturation permease subunit